MTTEDMPIPGPLNNVIRLDDERIKGHLDRIVRGTVERFPEPRSSATRARMKSVERASSPSLARNSLPEIEAMSLEAGK